MTKDWPKETIDHINRIRNDNRWSNLRLASLSNQMGNTKLYETNTSGYRGVCWHKNNKKWIAQLDVSGKNRNLGFFDSKEQAKIAYDAAAKAHFGEYYEHI